MFLPSTELKDRRLPTPVQPKDVTSELIVSMSSRDISEVHNMSSGTEKFPSIDKIESCVFEEAGTTSTNRQARRDRSNWYAIDPECSSVDFDRDLANCRNMLRAVFNPIERSTSTPDFTALVGLISCILNSSKSLHLNELHIWFQEENNGDHSPSWEWDKIFRIDATFGRLAISHCQAHMRRIAVRKRSYKTMGLGSTDIGE